VELLVCVGIIAILLAILLPTVRGARTSADTVRCQSNLREFYSAQLAFAADNRARFTPISQTANRWERQLARYINKTDQLPGELMHCPSSGQAQISSPAANNYSTYALNPSLRMPNWRYRRDAKMDSARIILMADKAAHAADEFLTTADGWFVLDDGALGQWWQYSDHNPVSALRHGKQGAAFANALMVDGHVAQLDRVQMCRDSGHWYWGSIEGMPTNTVQGGCCP
jgi:prepilin-type processing-associated H-X9-DG protein